MSTSQPPETFLAFVLDCYLDRDGQYWACPLCQRTNGSVSVNEPLKDHAIKCRCRSGWCEWPVPGRGYGDEYDVVKWFEPTLKYPARKARLDELRTRWEFLRAEWVGRTGSGASGPGATAGVACLTPYILPHGDGSRYEREFHFKVADAWAGLVTAFGGSGRAEHDEFARMVEMRYFADWDRVFTDALLAYWLSFVEWVEASDRRHNETCSDPVCDATGCRAKRGLPPLTADEISALWNAADVARARRLRRREEFMRDLRDHEIKERFDNQQEGQP